MKYPAVVPPHKTARFIVLLTFILPAKSKQDLDNLIKSCLDAANGVVYRDDVQVDSIDARKRYATNGFGVHFIFGKIEAT